MDTENKSKEKEVSDRKLHDILVAARPITTEGQPAQKKMRKEPPWIRLPKNEAGADSKESTIVPEQKAVQGNAPEPPVAFAVPQTDKISEEQKKMLQLASAGRCLVVDVETTTFGGDVIEIAAIELINLVPTGIFFHSFVLPRSDGEFHPKATEAHGMSRQDLLGAPSWHDVGKNFLRFSGLLPSQVLLVGHNLSFDVRAIENQYRGEADSETMVQLFRSAHTLCTMNLFRSLYPKQPSSLSDAATFLGIPVIEKDLHSALGDAKLTAKLVCQLSAILADSIPDD